VLIEVSSCFDSRRLLDSLRFLWAPNCGETVIELLCLKPSIVLDDLMLVVVVVVSGTLTWISCMREDLPEIPPLAPDESPSGWLRPMVLLARSIDDFVGLKWFALGRLTAAALLKVDPPYLLGVAEES